MIRTAAAMALVAALHYLSVPAEPRFSLCGFHWLTGWPCPLCGMTRGLFSLAKGRWQEAVGFNALTPLGFIMLFSLFWNFRWRGRLWAGGTAAFGVYGVARILMACI